ncbi:MAG: hypothetical protein Q4G52_08735 [Clostridia bacterium]|nr:hypothetical protein [Clostridia bacterium]
MKKLKISLVLVITMLLLGIASQAYANDIVPYASDDVTSASVSLSSSKSVTYKLVATRLDTNITVNYCYLYKKNANGDWAYKASMTKALPSDCTSDMIETCDASAYITESGTFRVKASFTAGNSTVTRTSNERTFD